MSLRVLNTNIASLQALRRLGANTRVLQDSFEHLSSGLRINRASDDAAGLAIGFLLQSDARVFSQAIRNVNDGISANHIAEGAAETLSTVLVRLSELSEQAANGTLSSPQRNALDQEAQALRAEFNRVVNVTQFNGLSLLNGSSTQINIQTGYDTLALNLGNLGTTTAGDGTFQADRQTAVAGDQNATGDINGDGKLDVVTVSNPNDAYYVMLGNGDGTLKAQVNAYAGDSPRSVALNDLNGDGKLDLIIGNGFSQDIATFLGVGDGTFTSAGVVAFGSTMDAFSAIGDFTGDGKTDVIVSSSLGTDFAKLYAGVGDGTFNAGTTIYNGSTLYSPTAADLNGDNKLDLLIIDNGNVTALIGNGNGTFKAGIQSTGTNPYNVVTADVNGDGILDAVTGDPVTQKVNVFIGNGNGSFKASTALDAGNGPWRVAARDVNGDGNTDIVSVSAFDNHAQVLLGNGNGTFNGAKTYGAGVFPSAITLADLNGDGSLDIVSGTGNSLDILLGNSVTSAALGAFNLRTQASALSALDMVHSALQNVTEALGGMGASESRLNVAVTTLQQRREDYTKASSQIMDVDVAEQSAELTRATILQQASAAVLSQANQLPQLVLQLLRNA